MRATGVLAVLTLLAGCTSAGLQGRAALGSGRYEEAARHFEEALAEEPGRVSDLIGLGVARYKLDALDEARRALGEALAHRPDAATAHLYLALVAIRREDDTAADQHLVRFLELGSPPRLAGQLQRTRRALQGPVTPPLREYMAASLEDAYQWSGEVAGALRAAREAELRLADERIYLLPRYCRCR